MNTDFVRWFQITGSRETDKYKQTNKQRDKHTYTHIQSDIQKNIDRDRHNSDIHTYVHTRRQIYTCNIHIEQTD